MPHRQMPYEFHRQRGYLLLSQYRFRVQRLPSLRHLSVVTFVSVLMTSKPHIYWCQRAAAEISQALPLIIIAIFINSNIFFIIAVDYCETPHYVAYALLINLHSLMRNTFILDARGGRRAATTSSLLIAKSVNPPILAAAIFPEGPVVTPYSTSRASTIGRSTVVRTRVRCR